MDLFGPGMRTTAKIKKIWQLFYKNWLPTQISKKKIKKVRSQQEVIDIAKNYGIDFTVETLEARAQTLPHICEDELNSVRWGRWGDSPETRRWAMNVWVKL